MKRGNTRKQFNIIQKWVGLGYIASVEQVERVVDRLVSTDIKSPYISRMRELSNRFAEMNS